MRKIPPYKARRGSVQRPTIEGGVKIAGLKVTLERDSSLYFATSFGRYSRALPVKVNDLSSDYTYEGRLATVNNEGRLVQISGQSYQPGPIEKVYALAQRDFGENQVLCVIMSSKKQEVANEQERTKRKTKGRRLDLNRIVEVHD